MIDTITDDPFPPGTIIHYEHKSWVGYWCRAVVVGRHKQNDKVLLCRRNNGTDSVHVKRIRWVEFPEVTA